MPGRWRNEFTPYLLEPARALESRLYDEVVLVCASQMGKTELVFNALGHTMHEKARPSLYVGPTEKLVRSMSLDRVAKMIQSTPELRAGLLAGQHDKVTEKWINGARLGFAWASSPTELASHPISFAVVDERDRMGLDVGNEGDPVGLVRGRLKNYHGSTLLVTSTPTIDQVSPIWQLWRQGTQGIWSWECPGCEGWFGPRSDLLVYDEGAPLWEIERDACLACPHCGQVITEDDKRELRAGYVYHHGTSDDWSKPTEPSLEPPPSSTASFLVNGLASLFPGGRMGKLARSIEEAKRSGQPTTVQTAYNVGFGELYRVQGERPDWAEVDACKTLDPRGHVPGGIQVLVMGVDVQRDRLYWCIRGFGHMLSSHLVDHGVIFGSTDYDDAWIALGNQIARTYGGLPISRVLVDSGYKPGSEYKRPENVIYQFCQRFAGLALPSKGYATRSMPVNISDMRKEGIQLVTFDSDHFKSAMHLRIRWPAEMEGRWTTHREIDEDYCRQVVAEEVMITPGGKRVWVDHNRANHYGDCEVLCLVAARTLSLEALPSSEQLEARRLAEERQALRRNEPRDGGGKFERFS